jgi:hypothetical protein
LIAYISFPKGVGSFLNKFQFYLISGSILSVYEREPGRYWLRVAILFVVTELTLGTARRMMNDLSDREEDSQRGLRWSNWLNTEGNVDIVRAAILAKSMLAAAFAIFAEIWLLVPYAALLLCQAVYDKWSRRLSGDLSVCTITIAYAFRAFGVTLMSTHRLARIEDLTAAILLPSMLATAYAYEWRHAEGLFLTYREIPLKPHAEFFASHRGLFRFKMAVSLLLASVLFWGFFRLGIPDHGRYTFLLAAGGVLCVLFARFRVVVESRVAFASGLTVVLAALGSPRLEYCAVSFWLLSTSIAAKWIQQESNAMLAYFDSRRSRASEDLTKNG